MFSILSRNEGSSVGAESAPFIIMSLPDILGGGGEGDDEGARLGRVRYQE